MLGHPIQAIHTAIYTAWAPRAPWATILTTIGKHGLQLPLIHCRLGRRHSISATPRVHMVWWRAPIWARGRIGARGCGTRRGTPLLLLLLGLSLVRAGARGGGGVLSVVVSGHNVVDLLQSISQAALRGELILL